jgi:hypothetical protein
MADQKNGDIRPKACSLWREQTIDPGIAKITERMDQVRPVRVRLNVSEAIKLAGFGDEEIRVRDCGNLFGPDAALGECGLHRQLGRRKPAGVLHPGDALGIHIDDDVAVPHQGGPGIVLKMNAQHDHRFLAFAGMAND